MTGLLRRTYLRWRRRSLYRRALASPARAVILRYHSIGDPDQVRGYYDPALSLPPERFRSQLRLLAERCEPATLDGLLAAGAPARNGRVRAAITFDDGLRNNLDVAVPILRECGFSATFFVTTAPLAEGRWFWISELWRLTPLLPPGRVDLGPAGPREVHAGAEGRTAFRRALTRTLSALPDAAREPVMDALAAHAGVPRGEGLEGTFLRPGDLRGLEAAGMSVGAHSRTHPHLDRLDPAHADDEVKGSRADLEAILGHAVRSFAYPNPSGGGLVSDGARAAVARAGFSLAVTSIPTPLERAGDALRLPRLGVYEGAQEEALFGLLARLRA